MHFRICFRESLLVLNFALRRIGRLSCYFRRVEDRLGDRRDVGGYGH
jgi:hypothetical protein